MTYCDIDKDFLVIEDIEIMVNLCKLLYIIMIQIGESLQPVVAVLYMLLTHSITISWHKSLYQDIIVIEIK